MMNRFIMLFLLLSVFCASESKSTLYVGAGGNYLTPLGEFKDFNKEGIGGRLEITNKNYCKLWYGLRFDYFSLKEAGELQPHFNKEILVSPVVKYAPFVANCYDNKLIPYVEAMLNLSSISGTDKFSQIGMGASAGIGLAYNFKLFSKCWMLEAEGLYSAPNVIYRDDGRANLKSLNVGLSLSVSL